METVVVILIVLLLMVLMLVVGLVLGYFYNGKKEPADTLSKEEMESVRQIINLLTFTGIQQRGDE